MSADAHYKPSNPDLAAVFQTIADYLSLDGESPYRILAYEKAAALFAAHPVSIAQMASRGELRELPGVGQAIEAKVLEYMATGEIAFLEKLRERYPEGLLQVMQLPGMGPRRTRLVWESTGVADLRDLERACREGRIRGVPGMGEKTEAKLLRALEAWEARAAGDAGLRRLRSTVEPQAVRLVEALRAMPAVAAADYAGSLRRLRSTVRDIDLVVASTDPSAVMDAFSNLPELAQIDERGDTKLVAKTHTGLGLDLRIAGPQSYGNLLQHFTGSADHNVALRGYAQRLGYRISEYHAEQLVSGRVVTCPTEAEVYGLLGLDYIAPELRENQGEIEAAETGSLPHLVGLSDLRGDLHVHSDWTDGRASLEDMALAARDRGLEYLCFCDHSQSLAMTGGLTPERLLTQIEAVRALDAILEGIRLLAGIEVDILADGRLDLPDDTLARLDFVTASIHSGFSQPREKIMERLTRAMRNPHVRAIGHPSGRLIGRREPYEVDVDTLARLAAETGTYLEINGSPDRLDLTAQAARRAVALGATVVVCSDAHSPNDFENLRFGIQEARRGWLRVGDVANTLPWNEVAGGQTSPAEKPRF
ncbi:MAG: DNA polymerase/3'-5' exonuclease PolX [Thermoleophilia bacterium]|nr:DNA polymerase/3'-5' exonuclease PolX [Thermoleophilia bacterium]